MLSDCYEKGHTAYGYDPPRCSKCDQPLFSVSIGIKRVWHTRAELDRLWKGVDREAARVLGEEGG